MEKQKIGSFSQEVIELLELKITAGTPIYIGSRWEGHPTYFIR